MANYLNEIKKSVLFIYLTDQNGGYIPVGTGFLVGVTLEEDRERCAVYLVTAKHVLQDQAGNYLSEIFIRLNTRSGDSVIHRISLKDLTISEHPDKDVDIALFNFLPNESVYDFKLILDEMIASKDIILKHNIAEGDEVFFSGLFVAFPGQKKIQPIIRFGRVALVPDEKIEWKDNNKPAIRADLLLLECQSFGGNSGSPVFYRLSPMRNPGQINVGGPEIFLAGIMKGSFLNFDQIRVANTAAGFYSAQNIGIAAVTPADKLHEILFSKLLIEARKMGT
jgi:hypothetical protein